MKSNDLVAAYEAQITELREEVEHLKAERVAAGLRGLVKGYQAGENTDGKAWRVRAEKAEADLAALRVERDKESQSACNWMDAADRNRIEAERTEAALAQVRAALETLNALTLADIVQDHLGVAFNQPSREPKYVGPFVQVADVLAVLRDTPQEKP